MFTIPSFQPSFLPSLIIHFLNVCWIVSGVRKCIAGRFPPNHYFLRYCDFERIETWRNRHCGIVARIGIFPHEFPLLRAERRKYSSREKRNSGRTLFVEDAINFVRSRRHRSSDIAFFMLCSVIFLSSFVFLPLLPSFFFLLSFFLLSSLSWG